MSAAAAPLDAAPRSAAWRRVGTQRDILGECPLWDERRQCLWWVDIRAPALRCLHPADGALQTWPMPEALGSMALADDGRLLLALGRRLVLWDAADGRLQPLATPDWPDPEHRFNDGRCDRQGRFWVGTMHNRTRAPEGRLYRLDQRGLVEMDRGLCIPNSLAFSPDGRVMYRADSLSYRIERAPYDPDTGTPGPVHTLATTVPPGFPDGSAVDAGGGLWNAEFNAGRIVRYAPDGRIDRIVPVPVPRPTCCVFGGPDLATLYVTTASQQMSADELAAMPLAGALLAFEPGERGLVEPRFAVPAA
ncbi:MAG: SMP-30/gluconolactonase/LRE family protein [Aquabacterium sp.]